MGNRERNRERYALLNDDITCGVFRSSVVDNEMRVWRICDTILTGKNRTTGRRNSCSVISYTINPMLGISLELNIGRV